MLMSVTATYPSDAGSSTADAGVQCTSNCSGSTLTEMCSDTVQGETLSSTVVITLSGSGGTGTVSDTIAGMTCGYTLVITKQ
jgi:hypothetical protein